MSVESELHEFVDSRAYHALALGGRAAEQLMDAVRKLAEHYDVHLPDPNPLDSIEDATSISAKKNVAEGISSLIMESDSQVAKDWADQMFLHKGRWHFPSEAMPDLLNEAKYWHDYYEGNLQLSPKDEHYKKAEKAWRLITRRLSKLSEKERKSPPKVAAGLALVRDGEILLVHPTNAPWMATYSVPKGKAEEGETAKEAAIREVAEETGIKISKGKVKGKPVRIRYRRKSGTMTKELFVWKVDVSDMGLPDVLPKKQLQIEEVDWAGFLGRDEARKCITRRQRKIMRMF